jgi:hypothetical protein
VIAQACRGDDRLSRLPLRPETAFFRACVVVTAMMVMLFAAMGRARPPVDHRL